MLYTETRFTLRKDVSPQTNIMSLGREIRYCNDFIALGLGGSIGNTASETLVKRHSDWITLKHISSFRDLAELYYGLK